MVAIIRKTNNRARGVAQVVKSLPSKHEALSPNIVLQNDDDNNNNNENKQK
jgi:predicted double-glycine peptidase